MKKGLCILVLVGLVAGLVGIAPTPVSAAPLVGDGEPDVCITSTNGWVQIPASGGRPKATFSRSCTIGSTCCYEYKDGLFGYWSETSRTEPAIAPAEVVVEVEAVTGTCPGGATLSDTGGRVDFVNFPVGQEVCSIAVGDTRYVAKCLSSGWDLTEETCSVSYARSALEGLGAVLRDAVAVVSNPPPPPPPPPVVGVPGEAYCHQTSFWTVFARTALREAGPAFQGLAEELEELGGIVDYQTLVDKNLTGVQFSRHAVPSVSNHPHSYQLWVGNHEGCVGKGAQMVNVRGWYPPVQRSHLLMLISEEQRLIGLGAAAPVGQLAKIQSEIEMGVTRLGIATAVVDSPYEKSLWRPIVLGVQIPEENLLVDRQSAVVKSGLIPWSNITSVTVGTDITAAEEAALRAELPGVQVFKDTRLNWSPTDTQSVNEAMASLRDSSIDEELIIQLQNPATRQATATNLWGRLPDPIYRAAAAGNDFVLYQLPQLATYAYIGYVEGQVIVDLWETAGEFNAATTNMSWVEWILTHSASYQELARWVPFPTVDRVTLRKDQPLWVVLGDEFHPGYPSEEWLSHLGAPLEIYPDVTAEQPLNGNRFPQGDLGGFVLIFRGWENGQPVVNNINLKRVDLDTDTFVGICVRESYPLNLGEYLVAYRYNVRWERGGAEDQLYLRLIPAGRYNIENGICPW